MKKNLLLITVGLFTVFSQMIVCAQNGNIDFVDASEKSIHAVVHVKTEFARKNNLYDYYFDLRELFSYSNTPIIATGSGVLISNDGYIVTNNHVVQDATSIEITLNDKRTYMAEIVGTDSSSDLALLKIDERNLPFLSFGNSDNVRIGEWVLAVGNPLNLTSTVTAGIVSAKARNINILPSSQNAPAVESYIQTDAVLNRGNSGGALVNTKGELIGINAAIASGTGYYTGYSFAIPVNIVKKIVADLKIYGKVQRAVLGVKTNDITSAFANQAKLSTLNGVHVSEVFEHGNAKMSGIKQGDVITAIDNKSINSVSELAEKMSQYHPNDKINVQINRQGKDMVINVLLAGEQQKTDYSNKTKFLGAEIKNATKEELAKYNATNGVIISKIYDGVLKNTGIKEGFLMTKIDHITIKDVEQLIGLLTDKRGGVLIEGRYLNGIRAYYGIGM